MEHVQGPAAGQPVRVRLYGRAECHLCDDARTVVEAVCAAEGVAWVETDIDTDPGLATRYGDYVPVVTVDGVQQAFWRVDAVRLARALRRGAVPDTVVDLG